MKKLGRFCGNCGTELRRRGLRWLIAGFAMLGAYRLGGCLASQYKIEESNGVVRIFGDLSVGWSNGLFSDPWTDGRLLQDYTCKIGDEIIDLKRKDGWWPGASDYTTTLSIQRKCGDVVKITRHGPDRMTVVELESLAGTERYYKELNDEFASRVVSEAEKMYDRYILLLCEHHRGKSLEAVVSRLSQQRFSEKSREERVRLFEEGVGLPVEIANRHHLIEYWKGDYPTNMAAVKYALLCIDGWYDPEAKILPNEARKLLNMYGWKLDD